MDVERSGCTHLFLQPVHLQDVNSPGRTVSGAKDKLVLAGGVIELREEMPAADVSNGLANDGLQAGPHREQVLQLRYTLRDRSKAGYQLLGLNLWNQQDGHQIYNTEQRTTSAGSQTSGRTCSHVISQHPCILGQSYASATT